MVPPRGINRSRLCQQAIVSTKTGTYPSYLHQLRQHKLMIASYPLLEFTHRLLMQHSEAFRMVNSEPLSNILAITSFTTYNPYIIISLCFLFATLKHLMVHLTSPPGCIIPVPGGETKLRCRSIQGNTTESEEARSDRSYEEWQVRTKRGVLSGL